MKLPQRTPPIRYEAAIEWTREKADSGERKAECPSMDQANRVAVTSAVVASGGCGS